MKGEISAMIKTRKGKSENPLKVVGSGRWTDCYLLTAAAVPELIFARIRIPVSAVGIIGPTQHHVSSPTQAKDEISTISHTPLISCKEMI